MNKKTATERLASIYAEAEVGYKVCALIGHNWKLHGFGNGYSFYYGEDEHQDVVDVPRKVVTDILEAFDVPWGYCKHHSIIHLDKLCPVCVDAEQVILSSKEREVA